jgi:hypothetical protein
MNHPTRARPHNFGTAHVEPMKNLPDWDTGYFMACTAIVSSDGEKVC